MFRTRSAALLSALSALFTQTLALDGFSAETPAAPQPEPSAPAPQPEPPAATAAPAPETAPAAPGTAPAAVAPPESPAPAALPPTPLAPTESSADRRARRARPVESESGPPTLFGKKMKVGGYGSLNAAYTRMFDRDGALLGLEGALLLDHRLSLGIAGYMWTNPAPGPDDEYGRDRSYQTGYLGAAFRYSFLHGSPVYFTAGGIIGSGAILLAPDEHRDDDNDDVDIEREDVDFFAVFQPEVTVHANLTRWLRVGLTAGYRFTAGVDRFGMGEEDVNGVVAGGHLQFGRF